VQGVGEMLDALAHRVLDVGGGIRAGIAPDSLK
jgi:hypothetical protein